MIHMFVSEILLIYSKMSGRSKKVKVWVRVRPTANLALDMLDLQKDGKVSANPS